MQKYILLLFLVAPLFGFKDKEFVLPEYKSFFLEEYGRPVVALAHKEDSDKQHSSINGNFANDQHKMHLMLGPNLGLVVSFYQASSFFTSNGWAEYQMPGFIWKTNYNNQGLKLNQNGANLSVHSRNAMRIQDVNILPYGGIDYLSLEEEISATGDKRTTKLFYVPVGMALFSDDSMVFHLALSGMLWGDVSISDKSPDVKRGYGVLLGFLWHKSSNTSCNIDWSFKSYNVNSDSFAFSSNSYGEVENNLSSWNAKCDIEL